MKNWSKFSRGYYFRRITASFLVFCMLFSTTAPLLIAGPEGAQVINGNVTFDQNGNYTAITASDQSIVNYSSFNIGVPETVQFIQPSSQASILNRILSANPTMIDGTLLANGRVFFINPAGVMIGGSAKINVNQLVASALNMSDSSFLSGQYEFIGGDGTVSNSGQISAESVYLVGKQVINAGQINCPDGYVIMGAGDKVYLNRTGSSIVVEVDTVTPAGGQPAIDAEITNTGTVVADRGEIFFAVAGDVLARPLLANAGTLSARGGSVTLVADEIINTGMIDVSGTTGGSVVIEAAERASQLGTVTADATAGDGGTINITANELVVLGSESVTTANAGTNGDGGEIIAYSAGKAVLADGAIAEAKGGTESGDGGFMELSGLEGIELNSIADLSASAGLAGTLLLDPVDVWISNVSPGTEGTSWIDAVWLGNQLNVNFVSLNTDGDWGSPGDITVADSVSWASLYGLELYAYRNISVNAGITNTGDGHLTLDARGDIVVNAPISLNGGHLAMFAAKTYVALGIQINDDITAGSMRLKTGEDGYVTEQWFSGVFVGDGAKLETVKVNGSSGDIVIGAVHDVILGNGDEIDGVVVDAAGQVYINADEDGWGDPLGSGERYDWHYKGGDLLAEGTIIARDGDVTLKGNAMELGDVTAGNGNLAITGRTSSESIQWIEDGGPNDEGSGVIAGYENGWGNIAVATDKILSADGNLDIIDAQADNADDDYAGDDYADGDYDGQMKLTGETKLTLKALGGKITSEHTAIGVTGSTLVMEQLDTLDTKDYTFFNQNDTNLELTSTGGAVISTITADGGRDENSADQWESIGAQAYDNDGLDYAIHLSGNSTGTIETTLLDAANDDIKVDSQQGDILATDTVTAHNGSIELEAGDQLTINKAVYASGAMTLTAEADGAGDDAVVANDTLTTRDGNMDIEGPNVYLYNVADSGGNMTITALPYLDYEGGTVEVHGLIADGSIDITGNDNTIHIYKSADISALADVDAGVDIKLNSDTEAETGVILDAGHDVILADGKTLTGDHELTIIAGNEIKAQNATIEVSGSLLTLQQGVDLNLSNFILGNQANTDLTLISTDGSVISDLDEAANSADKWRTITATAGDDITLVGENNYAGGTGLPGGIRTGNLNAGTDGTGSISIKDIGQDWVDNQGDGDDGTIHAYGNMTAGTDVTLHNKTRFAGEGTQEVTAGQIFTANGWLKKVTEGHLLLNGGASGVGINAVSLNGIDPDGVSASTCAGNLEIHGLGDVQISGDLTTFGEYEYYLHEGPVFTSGRDYEIIVELVSSGGVSIISDEGKIYTADGIDNDTLNVNITGNSDHKAEPSLGVDLPKNYDVEVETVGKAAIVIMSEDELKLGPDGTLTAEGIYYDDGSVDDRPSVDFLDHDIPADDKLSGIAIDIAIFLASNGGSVDVGSPTADLPDGAAMVADAYETVTFGTVFEGSLVAGNVDWLEVSSRMSTSWDDVWNSGDTRLPYVGSDGMEILPWTTSYIPRIESLDVGTGTWILGEDDDDSQTLSIRDLTLASLIVPPTPPEIDGIGPIEGYDNLTWLAEELGLCTGDQKGTDEGQCQEMQIYMAGAFMQSSDIQPYGVANRLRELAATLYDTDGSRVAALGRVVSEFANPDLPPSPEMMTSIIAAFDAHTNDGTHYASAAQWVEAMTEYVIILNSDIGWDMDKSVAFIMRKYGSGITEGGQVSVIAFVQIHLENI